MDTKDIILFMCMVLQKDYYAINLNGNAPDVTSFSKIYEKGSYQTLFFNLYQVKKFIKVYYKKFKDENTYLQGINNGKYIELSIVSQ